MKKNKKNIWKPILSILILLFGVIIVLDLVILPLYVSGTETTVPDVVGKKKDEAVRILEDAGLNPILQTTRFDEKYGKDVVSLQKPLAGVVVKSGRRVYLTVSGGDVMVQVPFIVNKTIREAQISLDNVGLKLGKIDSVESESPVNTIVEQQFYQGKEVVKGSTVNVKVSIGSQAGMVRAPGLVGKSLTEAETLLKTLSLEVGTKTYIISNNYLPNTVIDQEPSEGSLLKINDAVNLILTTNKK